MKFLIRDFSNWRENWASRNFITNSHVYSLLIMQAKMQTEINNSKRMAAFRLIGTAQIIRFVSYPIRKKSRFWLFCMWSVKEMYHASRKQITEIKGEGMITGYTAVLFEIKGSHAQWGDSLSDLETRLLCNSSRSIGTVIASWPVVPVLLWRDFQNQKCGHSKDHYGTIRNQTK